MVGCIHLKVRIPNDAVYPGIQKRVKRKRKWKKPNFKPTHKGAEFMRKIFGAGQRSMGSAQGDYPPHCEGDRLLQ